MGRISNVFKNNKNIFLNVTAAFFVKGGSMLVSLITLPAYIQFFENQTILGIWYTLLSILNWVLMFDLGLGNGLRNKLPIALVNGEKEKAQKYVSATYFATFFIVLLVSLLSWLIIPNINWNNLLNVSKDIVLNETLINSVSIIFIGIMFQFLLKLVCSILYAIQKAAIVNFLTLLTNIIILISIYIIPSRTLEENLIIMSWINVFAVNLPLLVTTLILFCTKLKGLYPKFSLVSRKYISEVMKIGGTLLWLQLIFMVISSTNEFLISYLTSPNEVVEYQAYFKIFNAVSSLFALALSPIWSAVTKAQAELNFKWILKLYKILIGLSIVGFFIELGIVPLFQNIIDIWLGDAAIDINHFYALIFAISGGVFMLHSVNTSIGNGLSFFRIQLICLTIAAFVNIPLAYLFVQVFDGWIGVVIANIVVLLPYEVIAPIVTTKYLNKKNKRNSKGEKNENFK